MATKKKPDSGPHTVMSTLLTSDPLETPQTWNLCVQNDRHTGPLSCPTLFGCVETAGSPLLSGSHGEDSSVIHNPAHLEQGVLLLIVPVNLDVMFCNRGRERPQSKEANCEEKAKDVETVHFQRKVGLTLQRYGRAVTLCQKGPWASVCTHA